MVDKEEKWHHPNPLQAVHICYARGNGFNRILLPLKNLAFFIILDCK